MSNTTPLRKPKHEKFAQLVAAGMSVRQAYIEIGCADNDGNARRLRNTERMGQRIDTLVRQASERAMQPHIESLQRMAYTRENAMQEALEALKMAMDKGQVNAAVAAITLRSKLNGLLIEKQEIGGPGEFDRMDAGQLRDYVAREIAAAGLGGKNATAAGADRKVREQSGGLH